MKNLIVSKELEGVIGKLSNLLTEGHLKYRTQRTNYFKLKDKPGGQRNNGAEQRDGSRIS